MRDPTKMKLHEDAEKYAMTRIEEYGIALIYESKLNAYREHANEVQTPHVDSAVENLNRAKGRGWKKNFTTLIGGALLGTSFEGVVAQYSANNAGLLLAYAVIGFSAFTLVFLGLRQ